MNFDQLLARFRAGEKLGVDELRFLRGELATRAAAMPATITAETSPADATRIEGEHTAALADVERMAGMIADAERAAQSPAHGGGTANGGGASGGATADPAAVAAAAVAAERTRITAIRTEARAFGLGDDFAQRHIDGGTDGDAFRAAILGELRTRSAAGGPIFSNASIVRDETDTRRAGMTAALVARLARAGGQRNVEIPENARPWAERELVEIAAECVGHRGSLRTARQVSELMERAFHSTSDFPDIFTNALNVRLLARYNTAAPSYRSWMGRVEAPDFRNVNAIRAGDFPSLQPIAENGEIQSGTFGESKEQFSVAPYGVMLSVSRQMLVNDQLGAIEQVLGSAGVRVATWENAKAYALLAANPTLLTDSTAVFASGHGNLAGSGAAISVTTIGAGRAAMRKQTTLDGIPANFQPVMLVTGPDSETVLDQMLTQITAAQVSNAVPNAFRTLAPVADSNITGNAWYLFADPMDAPCFVYGYLNGFEGPRLSSEQEFGVQGMRVKLEHDFGVGAIDYRGAYKNAGA